MVVPTYVISLDRPPEKLLDIRKIFPTAQHFPARDYRQRSPGDLLRDGTIGILGYTCMRYGRKRHSELSSPVQLAFGTQFSNC